LAGRAALERRIVHIANLSKYEAGGATLQQRAPLLAAEEFVSYHAVPLISKGQVKGVLETFHRARQAPTAEWREFLETLAGHTRWTCATKKLKATRNASRNSRCVWRAPSA
jgi:GAF domain-containing protein